VKDTALHRAFHLLALTGFAIVILIVSIWSSLALWYRLPFPAPARAVCAVFFAVMGAWSLVSVFRRRWRVAVAGFSVAFAIVLLWWSTITPPAEADWSPDVSRQVTGTISGDALTLVNVRDFDWRSNSDFTERWQTRTYDLAKLTSVDLFMSYWSGPLMGHMLVSFGFSDGEYLVWSVEVRRQRGGAFSPVADLFKSNPLIIIAAEERDIIAVRSIVRKEDVQIYRVNVAPKTARALLAAYVEDANRLARQPQWYNSLTSNCTTAVVTIIKALGDAVPFDWRLYINGYIPEYAYARGLLDAGIPMAALRQQSHIAERAKAVGISADFSKAIRQGQLTE
jgi:hypothetical protein